MSSETRLRVLLAASAVLLSHLLLALALTPGWRELLMVPIGAAIALGLLWELEVQSRRRFEANQCSRSRAVTRKDGPSNDS